MPRSEYGVIVVFAPVFWLQSGRTCFGRPKEWSDKRERQYEHIKDGLEDRGRSEDTAEEIAARTVNKQRADAGETKESDR